MVLQSRNPRRWLVAAFGVVVCWAGAYVHSQAVEPKPFFPTERGSRATLLRVRSRREPALLRVRSRCGSVTVRSAPQSTQARL